VTDEARAMLSADDAELLNTVRAGNTAAFRVLCERHEQAARRLARDLVATTDDVDDLVAQTFARLLDAIRVGGGPTDAFRPYLLAAVRRVRDDRLAPEPASAALPDPGELAAEAGLDQFLIVRAYLSLPERWMAVLWHAEIEAAGPAEIGPLFGLRRNGAAALRRQAKDGLRQAYLQMYISGVAAPECAAIATRLDAFMQDAADGGTVTEHLSQCDDCRAVFAELSDVSMPLRAMVAPVFLGDSTEYYLAGTTHEPAASPAGAGLGTAVAAGAAAGAAAWQLRIAELAGLSGRRRRWLAAGTAAVVVIGAIALAVSLGGHGSPLKPGGTSPAAAALPDVTASGASASATPAQSGSGPAVVPASARRTSSTPGSPGSVQPTGASSAPAGPSPSSSAPVQLAASVNVYSGDQHWQGATVVFHVSDTGTAGTGKLTVSVALPAGSWLITWPHGKGHGPGHGGGHRHGPGRGGGWQATAGGNPQGWSCQATSSGATCRHDAIPAGGQSWGTIFVGLRGSSACGQSVAITATARQASASAQSPQQIQC